MDVLDIEKHFAMQTQFNQANAQRLGLALHEYVDLNTMRLESSELLSGLLEEMQETSGGLCKDRVDEMGCILREMMSFAVNNRLYDHATDVYTMLLKYNQIYSSLN